MNIEERVQKVFSERMNINPNLVVAENYNQPLTSYIFSFIANDLVYLLYEIEKEFKIEIDQSKLVDYRFNTIQGIIDIVSETLEEKKA